MRVISRYGNDRVATVTVAEFDGQRIECVESVQPGVPREEKWVLVLSCTIGCPVRCLMCDAGRECHGLLSKEQMFAQIDYLVRRRYPDGVVPARKFKIQFTRMGEPSFNPAVLDVLEELPRRYDAPGLLPSVSTVAPLHCLPFLDRLKDIKNRLYGGGRFQMQFSLHTTDTEKRDVLIPIRKLRFEDIARFGDRFMLPGDRKITLNFIVMDGYPIDPGILKQTFDPSRFLVKLTPLNPTLSARSHSLKTALDPHDDRSVAPLADAIRAAGFDTIVSIGDLEENQIGSNCGQFLSADSSAVPRDGNGEPRRLRIPLQGAASGK